MGGVDDPSVDRLAEGGTFWAKREVTRAAPRAIDGEDETIAEPEMIVGFDDDLAGEAARVANRLHGLSAMLRDGTFHEPQPAEAA
ncbi:hypothetical protein [Streptomyces sp. LN704]|uniref:hypothetical protein n=1 Tax=Streptomyces sp. LN704 TaxID=3112982 RepID=UPI00371CECAD